MTRFVQDRHLHAVERAKARHHVHLYSTEAFCEAMERHIRPGHVITATSTGAWADGPTAQFMAGILPAERYLQDCQEA